MSDRAAGAGAFAAVAAALLLFFSPALAGGGQFLYRDTGRHYHPVKQWLAAQWRAGHYPEWNPHAGLGLPVVAGAIDAPQHPLNLLFLVLPFERAFTLWIVGCYLLAAAGAMAWLRTLGSGWTAAALGGLAFGLSGFMVSSSDNLIHLATMAAAPWLLGAVQRQARRGGAGPLLGVGLASLLVAAGGELLDWGAAVLLAAALALALAPMGARAGEALPGWPGRLRRAAAALAASLVGAAPAVLPFLAALPGSSRGGALDPGEVARWNLHPLRLLELVVPSLVRGPLGTIRNELYQRLTGDLVPTPWTLSLYLGAPVVALALLAARRSPAGRWLVGLAVAGLWVAMGHHAGFGALAARLPILASVRYFERLAGWPTLLLAAAAALGAATLLEPGGRARGPALAFGLGGGGLVAAGLASRLAPAALTDGLGSWMGSSRALATALLENVQEGTLTAGLALLLLGAVAWLVARGLPARSASWLLVVLCGLDLAGANVRAYLLAPPALVEARQAPIPAWAAAQPGHPRLIAPYRLDADRWPELLPYESSWRWGARTAAASFHVADGVHSFDTYAGVLPGRMHRFQRGGGAVARVPVAGLVGLAGLVVPHRLERAAEVGLPPPWRVLAFDPDLPAWLVEVPHRPRAYLAGELRAVDTAAAFEFLAAADPRRETRSVVEGPVPAGYTPPHGSAAVVGDEPDAVAVELESDGPALLVLDDQLEAGWRAEVDGVGAAIVPVNALVRGVWVPGGRHRVEYRYRTPLWRESWALLAAGALGLGLAARRRRPAPV